MIYLLIATLLWVGPSWRTVADERWGAYNTYDECIQAGSQLDWTAEYEYLPGESMGHLIKWVCRAEETDATAY